VWAALASGVPVCVCLPADGPGVAAPGVWSFLVQRKGVGCVLTRVADADKWGLALDDLRARPLVAMVQEEAGALAAQCADPRAAVASAVDAMLADLAAAEAHAEAHAASLEG
jgi:hypothetical protein